MASYKVGDKMTISVGRTERVPASKEYVQVPDPSSTSGTKGKWKTIPAKYTYQQFEWNGADWISSGTSDEQNKERHYSNVADAPTHIEGGSQEWGAADISAEDFIYEEGHPKAGEQRELWEVAQRLDPKLPGITGPDLMKQIQDMAPKYQSIAAKEREQKGFAKEAREKDVYGLSKEARKAGTQMRGAYAGGMGAGMRGAVTAGADISKGFEQAQQAYKKDIYGIEQTAAGEYETQLGEFVEDKWLTTPDSGVKKLTEDWGSYDTTPTQDAGGTGTPFNIWGGGEGWGFSKGGRVPNKRKTFLDLMTSLPEAGGS